MSESTTPSNPSEDKQKTPTHKKLWYKEPWLWFILAPLITSMLVSSIMVTVAIRGSDDVVSDNYYKEGRMLSQEFTSEEYAKSLGISAKLKFDWVSGEVIVDLNQDSPLETMELLISHPIKASNDQTIILKQHSLRRYRYDMDTPLTGRWYIRLVARHNGLELWRLNGEIDFSDKTLLTLE